MNILTIKDLTKSFGDKSVLKGLDLSVPEHSVFGFVGKNGAGKTTTMKAILGLLKPDKGEIYLCGERVVYGETATNRHIGYLPDVPEFYSFMTPMEYLRLCGDSLAMKKSHIEEKGRELLDLVGLAHENHRIKGFSRGMKQRLGIAQALLSEPKLLICDEPTSALDPIGRKEILDILLSVRKETTVLFSTHILSDVERICTDAALIDKGKIAMQGTVDELKERGRTQEFTVECENPADAQNIAKEFACTQMADRFTVSFPDSKSMMSDVLLYVGKNKIPVRSVRCAEPSLEALFMEVTSK